MRDPYGSPLLWIFDSIRSPLGEVLPVFDRLPALFRYFGASELPEEGGEPPDMIFFSAEIDGGVGGAHFAAVRKAAGRAPIIAISRTRSLAQAVAFFRNGVADYLPLPLDEKELRERFDAAVAQNSAGLSTVTVEFEPLNSQAREGITLRALPAGVHGSGSDEDILAQLSADGSASSVKASVDEADSDNATTPSGFSEDGLEPVGDVDQVDGLPIPDLWEELPCGLLAFDSQGNLAFANNLALDLFGFSSLGELQDALEANRSRFSALSANNKPLPDNQWPHIAAVKTRAIRSSTISIQRPDKTRVWLRIDCMPHLSDGHVVRLSMTVVNVTGEVLAFRKP